MVCISDALNDAEFLFTASLKGLAVIIFFDVSALVVLLFGLSVS